MAVSKGELPFLRLKARPAVDCCRDATNTPPITRAAAEPPRIHHRYFCRGSGASIGGPNPPPGRLLESARGALPAEFASRSPEGCAPLCWPVSRGLSPETLNARFCPPLVFVATRTLASGWFG